MYSFSIHSNIRITNFIILKETSIVSGKITLVSLKRNTFELGRVAQSVGHLTRKSGVLGSIPGLATYFRSPSAFSRRAVVSYWGKYVHKVLVNRLGGLSLPRKTVVRLTDRPDMTLDVYRGRKTTIQQQYFRACTFNCTGRAFGLLPSVSISLGSRDGVIISRKVKALC